MMLIVIGLRRSGTTIFWETLKQDTNFRAWNEPFNPLIHRITQSEWFLPRQKFYGEFKTLLEADGKSFWQKFAPIHPHEEIVEGLSDKQSDYLRYLVGQAEHSLIEMTRGHFKMETLAKLFPDATVVNLHKPPQNWALSHLVPSVQQTSSQELSGALRLTKMAKARIRYRLAKAGALSQDAPFDHWQMESVISRGENTHFGSFLPDLGLTEKEFRELPSYAKLMCYWQVANAKINADGQRFYGSRYLDIPFFDFVSDPRSILKRVYDTLGMPPFDWDTTHIKKPASWDDDQVARMDQGLVARFGK